MSPNSRSPPPPSGERCRTAVLAGTRQEKNISVWIREANRKGSRHFESNPNPKPKSVQLQKEKKEEGEEGKGLISPISNQNREKNRTGFNRTLTLTRDEEGEESDLVQIEKKRNQMKKMNRIDRNESG